jgi:hypothetical protein
LLGETLAGAMTFRRSASDPLLLGETIVSAATYPRSVSDALTLGEIVGRGATYRRSMSDALSLGETVTRMLGRPVSDAISLGDTSASAAAKNRSLSEPLNIDDFAAPDLIPGLFFVNAGAVTDTTTAGTITFFAPPSPQNGDIWILIVSTSTSDGLMDSSNISNWTFLNLGASVDAQISVGWFRYAGSNPDLTATWGGTGQVCGGIAAFRGCIATGSPVATIGTRASGSDASIEHNSITPGVAHTLVLACNTSENDNSRTPPAGFTAAFNPGGTNCLKATSGTDASVAIHYKSHDTGSTGSVVDTQAAAAAWTSVLIALRPP